LLQGDFKLIEEGGRARLYDLEQDPQETRDVSAQDSKRVEAMREAARQLRRVVGEGAEAPSIETELDPQAQEALRSLGYIR
jgi:hypothetical protein